MSATIFTNGKFQGIDNNGRVISYGKIFFTDHETGEPIYTYKNSARDEVNTHPVFLTGSGKADIFLDRGLYDVVLRDKDDEVVWTMEAFDPLGGSGFSSGMYQGEFTPIAGNEYPDTVDNDFGDFWNLGSDWTFITGDLAGQVATENDIIAWGVNGWALLESNLDMTSFLMLDGSRAMVGDLDMGNNRITYLADGVQDGDAVNVGQFKVVSDQVWKKDEFIDYSRGNEDANKPIKTNARGNLDSSFLEFNALTYMGEHDPRGDEYPDETGLNSGDFYTIDLPLDETYTFTTGMLAGRTAKEGDAMLFIEGIPDNKWGLIEIRLDPTHYVTVDGSNPMKANLSMGDNVIMDMADGVIENDGATVGQLNEAVDEIAQRVPCGSWDWNDSTKVLTITIPADCD